VDQYMMWAPALSAAQLSKLRTPLTDPSGVAQPAVEAAAPVAQYEMRARKAPQPPPVPSTRGFEAPPPPVPSTRGFKAPPPPGPRPTEKAAAAELSATAAAAAAELSATAATTQGLLDRIERLERGLQAALFRIVVLERFLKPTNVQPLATEPAASAVQSSAAGQLSTTAPPPAASASAAAGPQIAAATVQEELEYGGEAAPPPAPTPPPPALPPIVCFSIVTFGLRTLNLEKEFYNNDVLVTALAASWPAFHADVVIDARPFHDPDQQGFGYRHTGMHRDILTRIAWHPRFPTWWQQQMNRITVAPPQHRRHGYMDVGVAIYCNAGKHRSVAASIFLEVGLRNRGLTVAATQHLSRNSWPQCKGSCHQCTGAHATARHLLQNRGLL